MPRKSKGESVDNGVLETANQAEGQDIAERVEQGRSPETKEDRFKRLANRRVPKALKTIRHVANLANTGFYRYTPEQAKRIMDAIQGEVVRMCDAYNKVKTDKEQWSI